MTIVEPFAIGERGMAAIAAALHDPASLINGRSPGERGAGPMLSTKGERVAAPGHDKPKERVLASLPDEPVVPSAFFADVPAIETPMLDTPLAIPAVFPMGGPSLGRVPGGSPIIGTGIPGGGGPGGGSGGTPTEPNTPPPAVPEPGTWLMLLIGFFLTGITLRQRAPAPVRQAY